MGQKVINRPGLGTLIVTLSKPHQQLRLISDGAARPRFSELCCIPPVPPRHPGDRLVAASCELVAAWCSIPTITVTASLAFLELMSPH